MDGMQGTCTSVSLMTVRNRLLLKDKKILEMNRWNPFLWIAVMIYPSDLCALGELNWVFVSVTAQFDRTATCESTVYLQYDVVDNPGTIGGSTADHYTCQYFAKTDVFFFFRRFTLFKTITRIRHRSTDVAGWFQTHDAIPAVVGVSVSHARNSKHKVHIFCWVLFYKIKSLLFGSQLLLGFNMRWF